jgi:ankyrin repeat protein
MNGNEIMVKYLCEQGANVELVDNESHSLIHWITGRFLKFRKTKINLI